MTEHRNKTCKVCGDRTYNGTSFCTRSHRQKWIKEHRLTKKDWKRIAKEQEHFEMSFGSGFSNEGDCQNA
jgi:hypothetical protein